MASTQIIGGIGGIYDFTFDATAAFTISFTYNGNQITKNRIIVRTNSDNVSVYDNTVTSMRKKHTIPANTLTNGTVYNVAIQVYYLDDDSVEQTDTISDTALLKCLSTPTLVFNDLPEIVRNATIEISLSYAQTESDLLDYYQVSLLDSDNNELANTKKVYPAPSTASYTFSITLSNLFDERQYTVRVKAYSVSGMLADTGATEFTVSYIRPQNYSILFVDNERTSCSVRISSNIKVIDGVISSGEPTYIDNDKINLTDGREVAWAEMLDVSGDWQILLLCEDCNPYTEILRVKSDDYTLTLKTMRGLLYGETEQKQYYKLLLGNRITEYSIISNLIAVPTDDQQVLLSVRRSGNIYEVRASVT